MNERKKNLTFNHTNLIEPDLVTHVDLKLFLPGRIISVIGYTSSGRTTFVKNTITSLLETKEEELKFYPQVLKNYSLLSDYCINLISFYASTYRDIIVVDDVGLEDVDSQYEKFSNTKIKFLKQIPEIKSTDTNIIFIDNCISSTPLLRELYYSVRRSKVTLVIIMTSEPRFLKADNTYVKDRGLYNLHSEYKFRLKLI